MCGSIRDLMIIGHQCLALVQGYLALIVRLICEGSHSTIRPLGLGIHYALTSKLSHSALLLLLYLGPVKPVATSLVSPVDMSTPTRTVLATTGAVY